MLSTGDPATEIARTMTNARGEYWFTGVLWPEFDKAEFDRALAAFSGKQRRFGQTGDQVEAGQC